MTPLVWGAVWVLAATATAMLPMRRQMVPGLALLISAPLLLAWIGVVDGWIWVGLALAGFLSMFRRPLVALAAWAMGRPLVRPSELER